MKMYSTHSCETWVISKDVINRPRVIVKPTAGIVIGITRRENKITIGE